MRRHRLFAVLVASVLLLAGCHGTGTAAGGGHQVKVVAAFYPLQFVAAQDGGADVQVESLTQPGVEPHDLELTARQVGQIADADLVVYEKGFQPAVDQAVAQNHPGAVVQVGDVVRLEGSGAGEAGGRDPHFWQDPTKLAQLARVVGEALAGIDPGHAAGYRHRAADLTGRLAGLDREFRAGLRRCQRRVFVTSHAAFGYLARRYGLQVVGISGLTPDAEPSPARLRQVQEVIRQHGVTTVFYETLVSPKVARTLAHDLGVRAAVLDPIEGLTAQTASADYFSLMRANLRALGAANGCR